MVPRIVIGLFVIQGVGLMVLLYVATSGDPTARAIATMGLLLNLIWVCGFGAVSHFIGRHVTSPVAAKRRWWQVSFVLACTACALLEEAVTTSLSNLSHVFGDETGEAMITASTNYLDVVLRHSVIIFVPMFVTWAWMLNRWRFEPFAVLLLFGTTGMLAEALTFGPQMLLGFGQWIMVYGLIVYLPAKVFAPCDRPKPRFWQYPVAVVLPVVIALPFIAVIALGFSHEH